MRRLQRAPERQLVLRDVASGMGDTLRFVHSNMGDPYRRTINASFESGAFGDWSRYEHASVELNMDDVAQLRDWLNEQFPKEPSAMTSPHLGLKTTAEERAALAASTAGYPHPAKLVADFDNLLARLAEVERERDEAIRSKDVAYEERNRVVAALARLFPSGLCRTDIPGWSDDWHGCVRIDLPTGQVSWHFHDSHAYLFEGLPAYEGEWDGHDTDEKYRRVAELARLRDARGVVTEAMRDALQQAARDLSRAGKHEKSVTRSASYYQASQRCEDAIEAALSAVQPENGGGERRYPCARCGVLRTKDEGGTTFTVCDDCWDVGAAPPPEPRPSDAEVGPAETAEATAEMKADPAFRRCSSESQVRAYVDGWRAAIRTVPEVREQFGLRKTEVQKELELFTSSFSRADKDDPSEWPHAAYMGQRLAQSLRVALSEYKPDALWSALSDAHGALCDLLFSQTGTDKHNRAIDAASAALASLRPAEPDGGWQDVSTAPKDGTKVDLWVLPHDAFENGNPGRVADAWFDNGWRRHLERSVVPVELCGRPTYWRPLPTPPTGSED